MSEAKALAAVVRDYLQRRLEPVVSAIAEIRQTLATLPAPTKGDRGEQGEAGTPGKDGEQGPPGAAGLSAYQMAVRAGFSGTEAQWHASLVGQRGEQGPPGRDADPAVMQRLVNETVDVMVATVGAQLSGRLDTELPRARDDIAADLRRHIDAHLPSLKGDRGEAGEKGDTGDRGEQGERGLSGRDADPEIVRQLIDTTVAQMVERVQGELAGKLEESLPQAREQLALELRQHIDALLPSLKGERGEAGERGEPGRDADPSLVRQLVEDVLPALVEAARDDLKTHIDAQLPSLKGEKGERGENGQDGTNGRDADPELVRQLANETLPGLVGAEGERIAAELRLHIDEHLPSLRGERGDRGERGEQGEAGQNGRDADPELVRQIADATLPALVDAARDRIAAELRQHVDEQLPALKGERGERGEQGAAGRSAYETAVDKGYRGTELEWLESLRGKQGEQGLPGRDGRDGERGAKGEAGRDALELVPLDGIDENRSYPRGTWAAYRGGMICATRATDPIAGADLSKAGWLVTLNGVSEEVEEISDDLRTITRTTAYTNGKRLARQHQTASILDRGVWRPGTYDRGDFVSWGGSGFIAQRRTDAKPETNDDWRLAVKRGRDGKDGKEGQPGPQGKPGRDRN